MITLVHLRLSQTKVVHFVQYQCNQSLKGSLLVLGNYQVTVQGIMFSEYSEVKDNLPIGLILCFKYVSFRLKHVPRQKFKVCLLGDQQHCDEVKAKGIDFTT